MTTLTLTKPKSISKPTIAKPTITYKPSFKRNMPPIDAPTGYIHTTAESLVFNFVKDNSGMYTSPQIVEMLENKGYKTSTIASLISQMYGCGILFKTTTGKVGTVQKEFISIYNAKKKAMKEGKLVVAKHKTTKATKTTKVVKAVKVKDSVQAKTDKLIDKKFWINKSNVWNPEQVANSLNLVQAHALYSYMNQFFGDKKLKETV
jgi:hypothetical protein